MPPNLPGLDRRKPAEIAELTPARGLASRKLIPGFLARLHVRRVRPANPDPQPHWLSVRLTSMNLAEIRNV